MVEVEDIAHQDPLEVAMVAEAASFVAAPVAVVVVACAAEELAGEVVDEGYLAVLVLQVVEAAS